MPTRVVVQGDVHLVDVLSENGDDMVLSPVETSLEISARVSQADVLVVDVTRVPDALEGIRRLQYKKPVLALVAKDHVREALDAGAAGAIEVGSPPEAIEAAIFAVKSGLAVVPPSFVARGPEVHTHAGHLARMGEGAVSLTPREQQVLVRMADGLSNKEIAAELGVSGHTAKFHVNSILQKFNAQKRVEAVVRAAQQGLIHLN